MRKKYWQHQVTSFVAELKANKRNKWLSFCNQGILFFFFSNKSTKQDHIFRKMCNINFSLLTFIFNGMHYLSVCYTIISNACKIPNGKHFEMQKMVFITVRSALHLPWLNDRLHRCTDVQSVLGHV